jgi:hypothetical protein
VQAATSRNWRLRPATADKQKIPARVAAVQGFFRDAANAASALSYFTALTI